MATSDGAAQPTETVNARRTESVDAAEILKLSRSNTEILFGRVNVVNIIEKAVLAVTLHNDKNDILGHGAFYDYPNISSLDQSKWEQWFMENYKQLDTALTPLNTLFVHYFVTKKDYSLGCGREIIRTVFNAIPELHHIILAVPIGSFPDEALSEMFSPIKRLDSASDISTSLFVCHRFEHVPKLYIRQARVEDHDDLTPIFNQQSDMLDKTYGNYFLAELIEAQDERMQCLVAEVSGTAVAFMSLSDDVNFELLNECFELAPYYGLRKEHEDDVLVKPFEGYLPSSYPEDPLPMKHIKSEDSLDPGIVEEIVSVAESKECTQGSKDNNKTSNEEMYRSLKVSVHGKANDSDDQVIVSSMLSVPSTSVKAKTSLDEIKSSSMASLHSSSSHSSIDEDKVSEDVIVSPKLSEAHMMSREIDTELNGADFPSKTHVSYSLAKIQMPQLLMRYKSHPPPKFVPKYFGGSNAFAIQLFCIEDQYETRSCDFLEKAFAAFPDKEYCIITVPHLVPVFPLLQLFTRVTPRCPSTLAQELYVFHKSGLLKNINVRLACTSDTEGVTELVKTLNLSQSILQHLDQYNKLRRDEKGVELQAFIAELSETIVGICILQHENEIEHIRSHYNIEDFIYFNHHARTEHGHIYHFALSPACSHYTKHFLKEIMRIGHKSSLYYPVYPEYLISTVKDAHSMATCLNEMVPVHPRRQIDYPVDDLGINAPSRRVLQELDPYALNHINCKLTMEPKVTINARIVVVGASDVGLAFLQTLAYCPHLRFNNLTLISPHGLPGEMEPEELQISMLSKSYCYDRRMYANMGLKIWVNSVYGKMTGIDRARKVVVVNQSTQVPYDHLILCTGKQYQIPAPCNVITTGPVSQGDIPQEHRTYIGSKPENIQLINDEFDSALLLYWVEINILNNGGQIVIYGEHPDTYCTIQALLKLGVSGSNIAFVRPPSTKETTCFNDQVVDDAVHFSIVAAGVKVYDDYVFSYWAGRHQDSLKITSVTFVSTKADAIHLECGLFLSFALYGIDNDAFQAVNDACLVFDGHLVIDAAFHTNDASIRAAGPLTKFKRRYHVGDWSHALFNSKEVGIALASAMLRLFDPTLEPLTEPPKEVLNLIPIYRNAKIYGCTLPGDYELLHLQKPNLPIPLNKQRSEYGYGREMITGDPSGNGYFRLHFNQYNSVDSITCLSKKPFSVSNLMCLYGLHERFLNNILVRYQDNLIPDLYAFLNEPWAMALFHDRFDDFCDEIRELMMTKSDDNSNSVEETLRTVVDDEVPLSVDQLDMVRKHYLGTGTKHVIETRLLNYLGYNYYHLPMYAKPGMV